MSVSDSFLSYVLDQFAALGELRARRMFGGVGLYCGERFFALLADNVLYLKVDDGNREQFLARGMPPFRPYADRPEHSMSYYQVPADILEDADTLAEWGRRSVRAASVQSAGRRRRPTKSPRSTRPRTR
jgi:DNA transformation protein